ncbi:hypothetical protein HPULCUR_006906 [Helicostylum pulchrum]|uniref:Uncharacterized protein n=1 Tax=Helicostylum pulchrum TaxID=562976 RepID=A0ABP9Y435_9FUNG
MHISSVVLVLSCIASLQLVSAAPLVTETKFVLAKRACPPGTAPGPPPPPPTAISPAECYRATQNIACYQPPPPAPPAPKSKPKAGSIGLPDLSCYVLPAAPVPGLPAPPILPGPTLPAFPAPPILPGPTLPTAPGIPALPGATLPDLSTFVLPGLPGLPELPVLPGLPGLPALGGD